MEVIKFQDKDELALEQYNLENVKDIKVKLPFKKGEKNYILGFPFRVTVCPTTICQWGCPKCSQRNITKIIDINKQLSSIYDSNFQTRTLSTHDKERIEKISDALIKLEPLKDFIEIDIDGGEPGLDRPLLIETITLIKSLGFKISSYFTNGTNIINNYDNFDSIIEILNKFNIKTNINLNISHYDEIKRRAIFESELISRPPLLKRMSLPITNKEIEKLAFYCWANKMDLKLTCVLYFSINPTVYHLMNPANIDHITSNIDAILSIEEMLKYIDYFRNMKITKFIFKEYIAHISTKHHSPNDFFKELRQLYNLKYIETLKNKFMCVDVFDMLDKNLIVKRYNPSIFLQSKKGRYMIQRAGIEGLEAIYESIIDKEEMIEKLNYFKNKSKGV